MNDHLREDKEQDQLNKNKGSRSYSNRRERRKWNQEEDTKLGMLIKKYGTSNWRSVSAMLPDRSAKQCRERWINHLDPAIIKGKLTAHEWNIVLQSQGELGNRWSEIAKLLPGRTPNQIKNVWHAMARREVQTPIKPKRKYLSGPNPKLVPDQSEVDTSENSEEDRYESNSDESLENTTEEDLLPEEYNMPVKKSKKQDYNSRETCTRVPPLVNQTDKSRPSHYTKKLQALIEIALYELCDIDEVMENSSSNVLFSNPLTCA